MSDPAANTPPTSSDKSTKASRKAGASPAAEGSAPSAVLASTDGALTEPMLPREAAPPEEIVRPAEVTPRAQLDDHEPPSDPAPRRFARGSRIDEDEIPEEALDALVRGLAKRGYVLAKAEPAPVADENVVVIPDADVAALAGALTDAQVQELLAIRANGVDLQKWRARGAIPGMHWIPTARARCTIAGVPGQELVPNQPVLMSDLDEATTKQFLANGTIHAPGQEPRNPHKRA